MKNLLKLGILLKQRLPGAMARIEASRILESSYFDYEYYALYLGAKREQGKDVIDNHYLKVGHSKSLSPTRYFSTTYYLFQCRESKLDLPKKVNPFQHYVIHGWKFGFDPHPLISNKFYLERYPDVAQANMEPVYHFISNGLREGRHLTPWYNQEHEADSLRYFADPLEVDVEESLYLAKLRARVFGSKYPRS